MFHIGGTRSEKYLRQKFVFFSMTKLFAKAEEAKGRIGRDDMT